MGRPAVIGEALGVAIACIESFTVGGGATGSPLLGTSNQWGQTPFPPAAMSRLAVVTAGAGPPRRGSSPSTANCPCTDLILSRQTSRLIPASHHRDMGQSSSERG